MSNSLTQAFGALVEVLSKTPSVVASATAAAARELSRVWSSELANGQPAKKMMIDDVQGVIQLLQAFQRDAASCSMTHIDQPALVPDLHNAGNDYTLDTTSGHASVWITMGAVTAYISSVGNNVSVELLAKNGDQSLELASCATTHGKAKKAIRNAQASKPTANGSVQ